MTPLTPLAEYLRARRDHVSPESVGLAVGPAMRRVPGLRREEVALLAGISPDYYLRLEQGRELHPSAAVLQGLVRALDLDRAAADHLHGLAWPQSSPPVVEADDDALSEHVLTLVRSLSALPVHVNNRYHDLLFVNPLNRALSPAFAVGNNLARMMFSVDMPHDAYWRISTQRAVAHLRASVGPADDSPRLRSLVAELSAMSERFRELWQSHEVTSPAGFPMAFHRNDVGSMEFRYQTFTLPGTNGKELSILSPAPGGPSARALEMLSLMIADSGPDSDLAPDAPDLGRRWSAPSGSAS